MIVLLASREVSMVGSVSHASARRHQLIWRGVCPSNKSTITRRRRIDYDPTLSPWGGAWQRGRLCWPPRLDTPHQGQHGGRSHGTPPRGYVQSRGATPNQTSDTGLRQTRFQPRHDRRAILTTKHPTTPHNQPPTSIIATRKLLTPYDTAVVLRTV